MRACMVFKDMHTATLVNFLNFLSFLAFVLQELYEYVFSTGFVEGSFTLCTAFPRQDLMPSEQSAGNYGVITVEIRDDSPELLTTFGDVPTTFASCVVRERIGPGAPASSYLNLIFQISGNLIEVECLICMHSPQMHDDTSYQETTVGEKMQDGKHCVNGYMPMNCRCMKYLGHVHIVYIGSSTREGVKCMFT